jgi:aspartyl/asparaginyl beta-hydroxylase (cupin superfamily)
VLRTHLGLVCPEGCWIKVDNESYTWKAGKAVLFNDMLLHEAANESDEDRVVLIVDIQKGEAC